MTAPRDHRTYPVQTLPVFDLRTGDVAVGTESEIIEIVAEKPWTRRLTERYPDGRITRFVYDCADELMVYRKPQPVPGADTAVAPRSGNTGRLAGIRCPRCSAEGAFVVQVTLNVVLLDDGMDLAGSGSLPKDHFPTRVIDFRSGLAADDPIQCHEGRGGCGHRGRVREFRISVGADAAR